ncbi:MAG TPA: hypothetical protein PK600_10615 [Deltaproteobacteria bacterium]|nr:hypothetical protein [Deltaproteobacteria bacterium]
MAKTSLYSCFKDKNEIIEAIMKDGEHILCRVGGGVMIASFLSEGGTHAQGTGGGAPCFSLGISCVSVATRGCMK